MIARVLFSCCYIFVLLTPFFVHAQNAGSLPVASTLEVMGALPTGGEVVVYDEKSDSYSISKTEKDSRVFGVTALRPALVYSNSSGTTPVVTSGSVRVQVNTNNGPISRGDLLVSSKVTGQAMKANLADDQVFAIALEGFGENGIVSATPTIFASVSVSDARSLQETRRTIEIDNARIASTSSSTVEKTISIARLSIATLIALGGLAFVLFSFRSALAKGIVSIGRNPRARISIMTLAFGNLVFALVLCAFVIFVAIAVLVLPI